MVEDTNEKFRLATEALVAARQKVSEAEQKKATAKARLAQVSQNKTQAVQKVEDAKKELENADKQVQPATTALNEAEQQTPPARTEEEIRKLKEEKATAEARQTQAKEAKTQAEQEVENADKQVQPATAELEAAEQQLTNAQQDLAAAAEQVRQVTWAKLIAEQQEFLKQWLDEFRDAKELLEFAISRGYKIEDKIVKDIKAVEVTLGSGVAPTKDQLENFENAYRDLAYFLKPVTAETLQASFQKEYRAPLVVSLLIVVVAFLVFWVFQKLGKEPGPGTPAPQNLKLFFASLEQGFFALLKSVAVAASIFWFLYLFTGFVNEQKLNQIVLFCYVFCFVAIVIPLMSLLIPLAPSWFKNIMIYGPIGIVHGCVLPPTSPPAPSPTSPNGSSVADSRRWVPNELICASGADQWVLNIGGVTEIEGSASEKSEPSAKDKEGSPSEKSEPSAKDKNSASPSWPRMHIRGGMAVPLYVVMLSLMGGAVSMTRRVPEYQKRALDIDDRDMTLHYARENLVFQIMQVISAPLIAVTFYYLIEPTSGAQSVLLGFAAGFASEPILLAIRALVEKLAPAASLSTDSLGNLVDDLKKRSPEEKKVLADALKTPPTPSPEEKKVLADAPKTPPTP